MHFLVWSALAFALTIPIVVLLYLLKLKRVRTEISSTILWRRTVEDLMANAPFQRLRRNLLLYLQILVLLLAVLALMRPFLRLAAMADQNLIVLIDRSASMQSTDVAPSRLDVAKKHALKLVEDMSSGGPRLFGDLSRGDRMAVLAFSDHAEVIQSLTDDKSVLRRAILGIQPTDAKTRLDDSLAIARALSLSNEKSEVYILSDGKFDVSNLTLDDLPRVAFVSVGRESNNVGIVDLDLRESVGRQRESEIFASVRNFSPNARTAELRLLIDGILADAKQVELEPLSTQPAIFRNIAAKQGMVEVRLNTNDDLALDDTARGVLRLKQQYDVLLVGENNFFLEQLLTLQPDFRVSIVAPGGYSPETAHDLVIFDGWAPEQLRPGSYLMFNAAPPMTGVEASTRTLTNPLIVDWHRLHPLTRYVNFEPVNIQRAMLLGVPTWSQVLAESPDGPMIVLLQDRNIRCLVVTFSILDSDWPLHISYPVFLTNAVRWLAAQSAAEMRLSYSTGDTVGLAVHGGERKVSIQTPDGAELPLELDEFGSGFFATTDKVGLYDVVVGGKSIERFAVNLVSDEESNTSPTAVLAFEGRELESSPERLRNNQEIWFWLAVAALLIFTVEWLVYCKRSSL